MRETKIGFESNEFGWLMVVKWWIKRAKLTERWITERDYLENILSLENNKGMAELQKWRMT